MKTGDIAIVNSKILKVYGISDENQHTRSQRKS